jgi:hypothetical protein
MTDRPEWLQPPRRILVRHRSRLGRWYYLLRPFAIGYAALFWALREVLVWVVYLGSRVFWLINKLFAALFGSLAWLLLIYTRLRYGREAANELRRATAGSEAAGSAWRQRLNARVARRVGWPDDSDSDSDTPSAI